LWHLPGESVPIEGGSAKLQQLIDQVIAASAERESAEELTAEKLRERWEQFGGEGVTGVDILIESLRRKPERTIPFLAERLEQAKKIDLEALRRLLDQLESNRFAVREKASKELARLGDPAAAELRKRRDAATNEDLRKRLDTLLRSIDSPFLSGDTLRAYRGVEILERINTPEATELLKKLAKGEPEAVLTREAKAALKE
jgi:HEAT repeat protein